MRLLNSPELNQGGLSAALRLPPRACKATSATRTYKPNGKNAGCRMICWMRTSGTIKTNNYGSGNSVAPVDSHSSRRTGTGRWPHHIIKSRYVDFYVEIGES